MDTNKVLKALAQRRRRKLIRRMLVAGARFSATTISDIMGVEIATALNDIKTLVDAGLIRKMEGNRRAPYEIVRGDAARMARAVISQESALKV